MKSNTITFFKFISSLRNSSQNHRQVPACRNKQFEEDYYLLKGFSQKISVFIEASQNFIFYFLHNKEAKNLKTIGAYIESTDLISKNVKKIIHYVTQSLKRIKFVNKMFIFFCQNGRIRSRIRTRIGRSNTLIRIQQNDTYETRSGPIHPTGKREGFFENKK
jgi:hypothetical protein